MTFCSRMSQLTLTVCACPVRRRHRSPGPKTAKICGNLCIETCFRVRKAKKGFCPRASAEKSKTFRHPSGRVLAASLIPDLSDVPSAFFSCSLINPGGVPRPKSFKTGSAEGAEGSEGAQGAQRVHRLAVPDLRQHDRGHSYSSLHFYISIAGS